MELEEAIEKCKKYTQDSLDIWAIPSSYECEELRIAIDTVLEELDNSISKDKIENKIKELKEKLENVRNKEDRIRNGVAIIVLEYCIDSMNELLNK